MRIKPRSLLLVPVLALGIAAACSVIESGARDGEPVAAMEPAVAVDARPIQAAVPEAALIDFSTEIQPLLEGCRPCHFEGGKMYARMPFDDPATIRHEGEGLFTRIKDEEARELIRAFLAQAAE